MLPSSATPRFECPHCGGRLQAGPSRAAEFVMIYRQITCRKCGAPLQGRQGNVVFKYFRAHQPGALSVLGAIISSVISAVTCDLDNLRYYVPKYC